MIGLPTETLEEGQQTVNLIRSLEEKIDFYAHNIFTIFPGTPIFYNYEKYGMKLEKKKNEIHYKTIHTYDTDKIQLAPKSNMELEKAGEDRAHMKSMALLLSQKTNFNYFNKIILCADIITEELILWLQKYLAVNGPLIQIYSNFNRAKQYHQDNEDALERYMAPTTSYTEYYKTCREDGVITLTPFRTHVLGKQCGITINLVNTKPGLLFSLSDIDPSQSICFDREKEDVLQAHHLLVDLSHKDKDSVVDDLFNTPFYPYISSLCRWEKRLPNCRSLEIIIVDSENNVKTCWNGKPVGRVGMPFPEMFENLRNIHVEIEDKRDCKNCIKEEECAKCIFPEPLPGNDYCDLKRDFNTRESAELVRSFDLFKEL
jgi:hypothetical protein